MSKTILIAEDVKGLQAAIKIILEDANFKVLTASDGEEGLYKALTKKPDLILLDLVMPKMDGMAMLKQLRQDKWGKKVPVIILTNLSSKSSLLNAEKYNVDYYVKSDWEIEELVDIVNNKLDA